jgi:uncharacterized protein YaaW (UPF0174 family)
MSDDVAEGQPVDHDQEPQPDQAPPPEQQPLPVLQTEAAFLVFLDQHGHWVADDAAVNRPVQVARNSTFIDFHNAATTIAKDILVQETASKTVALQQQMAMQMAEQMQTRQVAESIGGPVGRGLHVPGR